VAGAVMLAMVEKAWREPELLAVAENSGTIEFPDESGTGLQSGYILICSTTWGQ